MESTEFFHLTIGHFLSYQEFLNASALFWCALCQGCLGMRKALWENFGSFRLHLIVRSIRERNNRELSILTKKYSRTKNQHIWLPELPDAVIRELPFVIRKGIQKHDSFPVLILLHHQPGVFRFEQWFTVQLRTRKKVYNSFKIFSKGSFIHTSSFGSVAYQKPTHGARLTHSKAVLTCGL